MPANESSTGGAIGTPTPDATIVAAPNPGQETNGLQTPNFGDGNKLPPPVGGGWNEQPNTPPTQPESSAPAGTTTETIAIAATSTPVENSTSAVVGTANSETPKPWTPTFFRQEGQGTTPSQNGETNTSQSPLPETTVSPTPTSMPSNETSAAVSPAPTLTPDASASQPPVGAVQPTITEAPPPVTPGLISYPESTSVVPSPTPAPTEASSTALFGGNPPSTEATSPTPVDAAATVTTEPPAPTPINVEIAATPGSNTTAPASAENGIAAVVTPNTTAEQASTMPAGLESFLNPNGSETDQTNQPESHVVDPIEYQKNLGEEIARIDKTIAEVDQEKVDANQEFEQRIIKLDQKKALSIAQKQALMGVYQLIQSTPKEAQPALIIDITQPRSITRLIDEKRAA